MARLGAVRSAARIARDAFLGSACALAIWGAAGEAKAQDAAPMSQERADAALVTAPNLPLDRGLPLCLVGVYEPGAETEEQVAIEVEPARVAPVILPEESRWVEREIVLRPEEVRFETVEAVFETRIETVVIEPERIEHRLEPATYRTFEEEIVIRPAETLWRPGPGRVQRRDPSTGALQHRVERPAETARVTRRELVSPPRVETRRRPASTREIEVQVMISPAETRRVVIPAETKTIRVLEITRPARIEERATPARMARITRRIPAEEGVLGWRWALCDARPSKALIRDVQRALRRAGYDPGPPDGELGPTTRAALVAYHGVAPLSARALLLDALDSLGVDLEAPGAGE